MKDSSPFYFLSSDEPLLLQEARDRICQQAHVAGFSNRQIITIESPQDWQLFINATQNHDLFSERQLIDVRHPATQFDSSTQQLLQNYVTAPHPDTRVILSCGKLTPIQKKSKWFQAIEPHIQAQFIWPLQKKEWVPWIQKRLQQYHLHADRQAIEELINLTEGNLLAAHQAIEKLSLLYANQNISIQHITHVIHDSTQFNVFDLVHYALAADTPQVIRAIHQMEATGSEPVLVLWALSRELREWYTLIFQYQRGIPISQLLAKQWASRKPLLQQAMKRLSLNTLRQLLRLAHETDLIIKGIEPGHAWHNLQTIAVKMSGV